MTVSEAKVLAVVIRDPDGTDTVDVYIDGHPVREVDTIVVDAGRGWEWEDWREARDESIALAGQHSLTAKGGTRQAYDDPPGGGYVTGRPDDVGWLD